MKIGHVFIIGIYIVPIIIGTSLAEGIKYPVKQKTDIRIEMAKMIMDQIGMTQVLDTINDSI